jgi:hypothetical protein
MTSIETNDVIKGTEKLSNDVIKRNERSYLCEDSDVVEWLEPIPQSVYDTHVIVLKNKLNQNWK